MNTTTKTREELQFDIISNNLKCASVESIERFKCFHYETYLRLFRDKSEGFIYNRMNKNGSFTYKWFKYKDDAIYYMNLPIKSLLR